MGCLASSPLSFLNLASLVARAAARASAFRFSSSSSSSAFLAFASAFAAASFATFACCSSSSLTASSPLVPTDSSTVASLSASFFASLSAKACASVKCSDSVTIASALVCFCFCIAASAFSLNVSGLFFVTPGSFLESALGCASFSFSALCASRSSKVPKIGALTTANLPSTTSRIPSSISCFWCLATSMYAFRPKGNLALAVFLTGIGLRLLLTLFMIALRSTSRSLAASTASFFSSLRCFGPANLAARATALASASSFASFSAYAALSVSDCSACLFSSAFFTCSCLGTSASVLRS